MPARGFTVIELITVLVIIGALAVFLVPRLDVTGFQRYGFRQEVLSAARHAQKTAMAASCPVRLLADAGSDRIELHYSAGGSDAACGDGATFTVPLAHPARGGPFVIQGADDTDITAGGAVIFDGHGSPDTGLSIDFAAGPSVTIEAITGYAHD